MRFMFFKKTLSKFSTALIISFIISIILFDSSFLFMFSTSFLGALYLFLGWLLYLESDGIKIFKNKSFKKFNSFFNRFDRFSYKNKGVYNVSTEDHQINNQADKISPTLSICSYLLSGIFLLVFPQIYHYFINS